MTNGQQHRLLRFCVGTALAIVIPVAVTALFFDWTLWLPAVIVMTVGYVALAATGFIRLDVPEKSRAHNIARSAFLGSFITVSTFSLLMLVATFIFLWIPLTVQAVFGAIGGVLFWLVAYGPEKVAA